MNRPASRDSRAGGDGPRRDTDPDLNSRVRDDAKLFSEEERVRAQRVLGELDRRTGVPIVIETIESLRGEPIDASALDHAKRSGSQGVFILIAKDEHKISDPLVSRRFLADRQEVQGRSARRLYRRIPPRTL